MARHDDRKSDLQVAMPTAKCYTLCMGMFVMRMRDDEEAQMDRLCAETGLSRPDLIRWLLAREVTRRLEARGRLHAAVEQAQRLEGYVPTAAEDVAFGEDGGARVLGLAEPTTIQNYRSAPEEEDLLDKIKNRRSAAQKARREQERLHKVKKEKK